MGEENAVRTWAPASAKGTGLVSGPGGRSPPQKAEIVPEEDDQNDTLPDNMTFKSKTPKSLLRP